MEEIEINKSDIRKMLYFIIAKFQHENVHLQGTSSKSDLIGGFIDRWINRLPEDLIFNKLLLKDKKYSVINDYFIYNDVKQNAPDVLGLIEYQTKRIEKFAVLKEKEWKHIEGTPHIEIKTFRKNQKMVGVREPQLEDENYYMFIEADLKEDYLIYLFDKDYLEEDLCKQIQMDKGFVQNSENDEMNIYQPQKVIVDENETLGRLKLLNTIKGSDLKKYARKFEVGETVLYSPDIEKKDKVVRQLEKSILFDDFFDYETKCKMYCGDLDGGKIIYFEASGTENIEIVKKNKTSLYIRTKGPCTFDGQKMESESLYRINYKVFERKSKWVEYIAVKDSFPKHLDKTEELIECFDKIMT